jgi:hypothetical protein
VNELQSLLFSLFPHCDDLTTISTAGFHGHLTLGQFPTHTIERVKKEFKAKWKPITFTVDCVQILSRPASGTQPFKIAHTISHYDQADEVPTTDEFKTAQDNWGTIQDNWDTAQDNRNTATGEEWVESPADWGNETGNALLILT